MNSVIEIVGKNERVVAVFTTHDKWNSNLNINSNDTGYTGDWIMRKNPNVEVLVIYQRVEGVNNIYKGYITSIEGPLSQYVKSSRFKIHFKKIKLIGVTGSTWPEFANCGANPVRYINT